MDSVSSNTCEHRPFVSSLDMSKHRPSTPDSLSGGTPSRPLSAQSRDSAFGEAKCAETDVGGGIDDDDDDTMSIPLEVKTLTTHLGRKHHSYPGAAAMEPVDSTQQSEWEATEQIWHTQGLLLPRIIDPSSRILDVGTGLGSWAIMMADIYPTAYVLGIDLAPIQPTSVPPNCHFLLDNAETLPWYGADGSFDMIHVRQLHWVKDWSALVEQAFRCLAPGGWFAWADLEFLPGDSHDAWRIWHVLQHRIYDRSGRSRSARDMARMMKDTGFINIVTHRQDVLEDADWRLREYIDTEGMTAPLHTVFGKNKEEIRPLADGMKREITSGVRVEATQIFAQKPKFAAD